MNKRMLQYILKPQEYIKIRYRKPYRYSFSDNIKSVHFVGTRHTKNPRDHQLLLIEKQLSLLASEYPTNTMVAVIEGMRPNITHSQKAQITRNHGEIGFAFARATQLGITCIFPDPTPERLLRYVVRSKQVRTIDIALWILLNTIWHAKSFPDKNFETSTIQIIQWLNGTFEKGRSFDQFYKMMQKRLVHVTQNEYILPYPLKKQLIPLSAVKRLQDPFVQWTPINRVGSLLNYYRDYAITETILQHLEKNRHVIAFFGANHAVAQEPVYREYFKKKKEHR